MLNEELIIIILTLDVYILNIKSKHKGLLKSLQFGGRDIKNNSIQIYLHYLCRIHQKIQSTYLVMYNMLSTMLG